MTKDLAHHTRAAAQAITGTDTPPDWMMSAVERMALELSYVISTDARLPTRVDLREQITSVRDASKLISLVILPFLNGGSTSLMLIDHLLREGEHRLEYERELHECLLDMIARCEAKLKKMPKGGGQGRAVSAPVANNTSSSSVVCAIAIQTLWNITHGRLPALNSEQAHRACSELWLAAGGKGTKTTGWRTYLQMARKPRYTRDAQALARQIGVQPIDPKPP